MNMKTIAINIDNAITNINTFLLSFPVCGNLPVATLSLLVLFVSPVV